MICVLLQSDDDLIAKYYERIVFLSQSLWHDLWLMICIWLQPLVLQENRSVPPFDKIATPQNIVFYQKIILHQIFIHQNIFTIVSLFETSFIVFQEN